MIPSAKHHHDIAGEPHNLDRRVIIRLTYLPNAEFFCRSRSASHPAKDRIATAPSSQPLSPPGRSRYCGIHARSDGASDSAWSAAPQVEPRRDRIPAFPDRRFRSLRRRGSPCQTIRRLWSRFPVARVPTRSGQHGPLVGDLRRHIARLPTFCRFRAAAVKNVVAACCSGEGPLAVATTSCPSALSTSTT